ncbi:MAG: YlxR family protein [Anaerolineales bacterium]|nr:YlxR family protein [Anaerolineales bacterium]
MPAPKRVKHIPQRTCIACRLVQAKRQLVRVVRGPNGAVFVDSTGKANGRGAYLHNQRSCWEQALKTGALDRALKVTITDADRATLRAHGQQYSDESDT